MKNYYLVNPENYLFRNHVRSNVLFSDCIYKPDSTVMSRVMVIPVPNIGSLRKIPYFKNYRNLKFSRDRLIQFTRNDSFEKFVVFFFENENMFKALDSLSDNLNFKWYFRFWFTKEHNLENREKGEENKNKENEFSTLVMDIVLSTKDSVTKFVVRNELLSLLI